MCSLEMARFEPRLGKTQFMAKQQNLVLALGSSASSLLFRKRGARSGTLPAQDHNH